MEVSRAHWVWICVLLLVPGRHADAATARYAATQLGCTGHANPERIERLSARLMDGEAVWVTIHALQTQGTEGCSALVDWLVAGAPGGGTLEIDRALEWVGHTDVPGSLNVVLPYAADADPAVREEAVEVLNERLAALDALEVRALVASVDAEVRVKAVDILAGYFSEEDPEGEAECGTRLEFHPNLLPFPLVTFKKCDIWNVTELPAAHADGLRTLAADPEPAVRWRVAFVAGRALVAGVDRAEVFGNLLLHLVHDDDENIAQAAAFSAGAGCPPNGVPVVEAIIRLCEDQDDDELADAFNDGLELGLVLLEPTQAMLDMATLLARQGSEDEAEEAEDMAEQIERKLERHQRRERTRAAREARAAARP